MHYLLDLYIALLYYFLHHSSLVHRNKFLYILYNKNIHINP